MILLFAVAIWWPKPSAPLPDAAQDRLLINVRIVDVEDGTTGELTRLRISAGRIAAIGPGLRPMDDEQVLDGEGGFLIPGLWDMHVHTFQSSPQTHFPLWIANGVTQVRDMMDCPTDSDSLIACYEDKQRWNAQVAAGSMAAPTIVETASFYLANADLTPREVVNRISNYDERGLEAIKVYNQLSRDAYFAAARESQRRGLRLVGHLPQAVSLEEALEAGQDSFEHAHLLPRACMEQEAEWRSGELESLSPTERVETFIEDHDTERCGELLDALSRSGSWYVPTHVTREDDVRAFDPAETENRALAFLDPLSAWAWNDDQSALRNSYPGERGAQAIDAYFKHGLDLTGRAHEAGVRILVGTDTIAGGLRYHDELAHLVSAGMAPAEVLRAATLEAARYAGQDQEAGSVAIGKRGDLVLLEANPLRDIRNTQTIRAVLQDGRLYDPDTLDELAAFAHEQANAPHNWAKLLWGFARSSVNAEM
ncbi:amidohydrolase family protein [Aurantiacibacter sediminis]|uniref:Amidohydrolase family protein n=1 Tax=Aurantiacibacter sediminis TaxID=2793064 RepID=A0ABS0N038_9SPHN|nr:amidohydrolase family protein [Aurantiacibacter sediminis]MBH5321322.1 amidohydrolase family protein [Aurantiacibacter sediminis]